SISHMSVRPIQNSPAGICDMLAWTSCPPFATVTTRSINKPIRQQILFTVTASSKKSSDFVVTDELTAADRTGLHVLGSRLRLRGGEGFHPVDTERGIDCRHGVVHEGLLFVIPTGLDNL